MSKKDKYTYSIQMVDRAINEMFPPDIKVMFIGSGLFQPYGGWQNANIEEVDENVSVILEGEYNTLEFIVQVETGMEWLLAEISTIPTKFAWGVPMKDVIAYLQRKNIKWSIICPEEASIL